MKWVIFLVLLQLDGRVTSYEIPTSGVYVRSLGDCEQLVETLAADYKKLYGAKFVSGKCHPY